MSTKKLIAVMIVFLLVTGLMFGIVQANAVSTSDAPATNLPSPDLMTSRFIFAPHSNYKLVTEAMKYGTFGIVTKTGKFPLIGSWVGVAFCLEGKGVINTDILIFSRSKDLSQVDITQGVFVKWIGKNLYVYFAHAPIIAVPWGDLSTWYPATTRLDTQELIYGKIIDVEKTGASESEVNYCCHPARKKVWYYVKISAATENEKDITMKLEVKVPDYELDKVLNSKGSYLWLSYRNLHVYILGQGQE